MNPDAQIPPTTPPNSTPTPPETSDASSAPQTAPPTATSGTPVEPAAPINQAPIPSPSPAVSNPFMTASVATPTPVATAQPSSPTEPVNAPTAPVVQPESNPFMSTAAAPVASSDNATTSAQAQVPPTAPPATAPVTAPGAPGGPATAALIVSGIGLVAWLLPIIGLPVTIVALILAIRSMKRNQKYAKVALGLAILGLVATVVNAAAGAYLAYNDAQKATSNTSQSSSETKILNTVPYPEQSRTAFIESCAANGGTETACTCMFGEIEKQLTFEEFSAVDKEIAETGNIPDSYRVIQDNAVATCAE